MSNRQSDLWVYVKEVSGNKMSFVVSVGVNRKQRLDSKVCNIPIEQKHEEEQAMRNAKASRLLVHVLGVEVHVIY